MNRREFMIMGAAGAAMAGRNSLYAAANAGVQPRSDRGIVKRDAPPRNRRP